MSSTDHVKYVRMPWNENTSIIYQGNLYTKWNLIEKLLGSYIPDIDSLINVIQSYNVAFREDGSQFSPSWSFQALREVVRLMNDDQRGNFFCKNGVLGTIQNIALQLRTTCRKLKWLAVGVEDSQTLHQMEVASILANAFFCTFPKRGRGEPSINFMTLFEGNSRHVEKLKCIINYFTRIHDRQPSGYITFQRKCTREGEYPRWDRLRVKLCSITVDDAGRIEDQAGCLQMDFANRTLGGGVLGFGCVQEEIRFVICPELIAARLFTEPMNDNEACIIIGAERFCNYSGYADNFQFLSDHQDQTPFDEDQRRNVHILAVDATSFRQPMEQYRENKILRDIKKIYTGLSLRHGDRALPLATGNWGCGAYRGDPELKSLLQIMAASQTERRVAYFTFGDKELKNNIVRAHTKLRELDISVGELYRILTRYIKDRRSNQTVFGFVIRAAEQYANAYAMARSPTPNNARDSPRDGPDLALKRNKIQSENLENRKDLPPWPRAWHEKEKPTNPRLGRDKPAPEGNFMEVDDGLDDFIPATPDQKQNGNMKVVVKQPAVSVLDALEEVEKKEAEKKFDGFSSISPSTSGFCTPEEGKLGEGQLSTSGSVKKEDIVSCDTLVGNSGVCNSPVSIQSVTQVKSAKKITQTKIEKFFLKNE